MLDLQSYYWHQRFVFQNQLATKMLGLNHSYFRFQHWCKRFYWGNLIRILEMQELVVCCFDSSIARTHRVDSVLKLCLNLCSLRWLNLNPRRVSNFKPGASDRENKVFFKLYERISYFWIYRLICISWIVICSTR